MKYQLFLVVFLTFSNVTAYLYIKQHDKKNPGNWKNATSSTLLKPLTAKFDKQTGDV